MGKASWLHLDTEAEEFALPSDLRARDAFRARDCGYLEQMRPFIREFSAPGERVLDPFCGFGTTLVAAHLEGRQGWGVEIEPERVHLAQERLARLGGDTTRVVCGDMLEKLGTLASPVDLILTSVPYFGSGWRGTAAAGQFYGSTTYVQYLDRLRDCMLAFKAVLKPGGFVIVMAENIRLGTIHVPLAWDVHRCLLERFESADERVIVYSRPTSSTAPPTHTNRAHEYALIGQNVPKAIDLVGTQALLVELCARESRCLLVGSFATYLLQKAAGDTIRRLPADADVWMTCDPQRIAAVAQWLREQGCSITRWGAPVENAALLAAVPDAYYLRAERLDAQGRRCVIDLCYAAHDADLDEQLRVATRCEGIRIGTRM